MGSNYLANELSKVCCLPFSCATFLLYKQQADRIQKISPLKFIYGKETFRSVVKGTRTGDS
jgi:hypothetical protein